MGYILARVWAESRQRKLLLVGLALFVLVGNYVTAVALGALDALQSGEGVSRALLFPSLLQLAMLGSVPIVVGSLLLEARLMGWERSSLNKLFQAKTRSIRSDLWYAALYCSHLKILLGIVMSLGIGYYCRALILTHFDFALLQDVSLLPMLVLQFLVGSFMLYVWHRIAHTRFFWEFHKVHHTGEDMTMVNNLRDHPVLDVGRIAFETLPAAVLGVPPVVLIAYAAVAGTLSLWFHSDFDWRMPFIERYVLIGARAHRIHHSPLPRHHHTNFGWLVLWERLFGTFCEDPGEIRMGLEDPGFNRRGTFTEMWVATWVGFRTLLLELVALVRFAAASGGRVMTRVRQ